MSPMRKKENGYVSVFGAGGALGAIPNKLASGSGMTSKNASTF